MTKEEFKIATNELSKRVPQRPERTQMTYDTWMCQYVKIGECPCCGMDVTYTDKYCRECGQALYWDFE